MALGLQCRQKEHCLRYVPPAELERFVASNEPNIPAMEGWRREVFGKAALALKRA